MKKTSYILFALLLLHFNNIALAGTASTTFQVSSDSIAFCSLGLPVPINFGSINVASGTNFSKSLAFGFTCTKGLSYSLKINGGQNYDGASRSMILSSGTDKLKYYITYAGIDTGVDNVFSSGTSTGTKSMSIIFNIPGGQNVKPGNYSDTIIFNIDY